MTAVGTLEVLTFKSNFSFTFKVRIKRHVLLKCRSSKTETGGHPSPVTGCVTLCASVSYSVNGDKESLLQGVIVSASLAQTSTKN